MKSQNLGVLRGLGRIAMALLIAALLAVGILALMRSFGPNVSAEYHYGIRHRR
jgi:hypothetical protein